MRRQSWTGFGAAIAPPDPCPGQAFRSIFSALGRPPTPFDDGRVEAGLTNAGALDRAKQIEVVQQLKDIIAVAAGDRTCRLWKIAAQPPDG